jgi:hypothetical protein
MAAGAPHQRTAGHPRRRAFAPSILTNATVTAALAHTAAASLTVVTFAELTRPARAAQAIGATASASGADRCRNRPVTTTRNGSGVWRGND